MKKFGMAVKCGYAVFYLSVAAAALNSPMQRPISETA